MKMIYYDSNIEIDFEYGQTTGIAIENPMVLDRFVVALSDLVCKRDEKISIFDGLDKTDFIKVAAVIFSPVELTYDTKEVQKALLNSVLQEIENTDLSYKFAENSVEFLQILNEIKLNYEYEIDFDENIEVPKLLKCFDIHLQEPTGTFVERMVEYISVLSKLLGKRIFIFVGCSGYIEDEAFECLKKHIEYEDVAVIYVESAQNLLKSVKNQYIMDCDLCEI